MRTLTLVLLAIVCLGFQSCAKEQTVQAGNDEVAGAQPAYTGPKLTGELLKVDLENDMITVRTPTGMEQTFRLDPSVTIDGVPSPTSKAQAKTHIRQLRGKEGEIVSVEWEDQPGPKLAMSIDLQKGVDDAPSKTK